MSGNSPTQQQRTNAMSEMLKKHRNGSLDKKYYDKGKVTLNAIESYRSKNKSKISQMLPDQKV